MRVAESCRSPSSGSWSPSIVARLPFAARRAGPAERGHHRGSRWPACSRRPRMRSPRSRPGRWRFTPELWVAGTSMTLLTVDAKLMPILPLIARPAVDPRPGRRVRDGLGVPRGAHRRAADRCGRAGAERARDVRLLLPGRRRRHGGPERARDHHRRSQPPRADGRTLRHHRDRPTAADRELRRRGDLVEGVLRGGARPPDTRRDHDAVGSVRRPGRRLSPITFGHSPRCFRTSSWSRARAV